MLSRVLSTARYHVNMIYKLGCFKVLRMLHESKRKRNAFPYLGKHASEAFNLIFTLSNHFTHFKTILKFLTLSIFFPVTRFFVTLLLVTRYFVTSLLCLVTRNKIFKIVIICGVVESVHRKF